MYEMLFYSLPIFFISSNFQPQSQVPSRSLSVVRFEFPVASLNHRLLGPPLGLLRDVSLLGRNN